MKGSYLPDNIRQAPERMPGEVAGFQEEGSWFEEVEVREYWRTVVKYRAVALGCLLGTIFLSVLYLFTATPEYSASARIRIGSYNPVLTGARGESAISDNRYDSRYLETKVQEIKSFSLADRALQDKRVLSAVTENKDLTDPGITASMLKSGAYSYPLDVLKSYLDLISVWPVRKTSLVKIQADHEDPALASYLANKHAESYITWMRDSRVAQQSSGLNFLKEQEQELRVKVAGLEREMADYAEANSIVALNKDENIVVRKMSDLNTLLTESTGNRIAAVNTYKETLKAGGSAASFDDEAIQQMQSDLASLQAEHSQLSAKFTPSYPRMKQLSSQIKGLRKAIAEHHSKLIKGLRMKAISAQQAEENLREELEEQKSKAFELSKSQVQYNVLRRELTTSRELLSNVLRQIKETALAVESNATDIQIVDSAVTPSKPSSPNTKIVLLIGLIGGAGLGLGMAFFLSYLDNTLRTPEAVESLLKLPNLGVVPDFDLEELNEAEQPVQELPVESGNRERAVVKACDSNSPVLFINRPKSLAAEAYRSIRTGILLSQAGEPPRTLLVTSAQSSEGKTTTSVNLAASLTGAGGRVVLVDADLRRPSVLKHFNYRSPAAGLVEVLTGMVDPEDVKLDHFINGLTVIPAGKIPPNPAELLGSLQMASFLDRLSQEYDYVLIDCPPVLPVTDSVILSRYVDGVIMVTKAGSTPGKVVLDAKNRLLNVGARVLGTVLNNVDVRAGDFHYYSRYYYSYYNDGVEQAGEAVDRSAEVL